MICSDCRRHVGSIHAVPCKYAKGAALPVLDTDATAILDPEAARLLGNTNMAVGEYPPDDFYNPRELTIEEAEANARAYTAATCAAFVKGLELVDFRGRMALRAYVHQGAVVAATKDGRDAAILQSESAAILFGYIVQALRGGWIAELEAAVQAHLKERPKVAE